MRVLLTHHFPLRESPSGWLVWHWAAALSAAGDEVRLLVVDDRHRFGEPFAIERVVCGDDPNADLTFALPRFSAMADNDSQALFASLSGEQVARYRECIRRRLDRQVMRFDPHVIHAQHVWLLGQLALETGVPYLLNAWGAELVDAPAHEHFRALAEQAADNASRILAIDEAALHEVERLYESAAEHTELMSDELRLTAPEASAAALSAAGHRLHALYQEILDRRFGRS